MWLPSIYFISSAFLIFCRFHRFGFSLALDSPAAAFRLRFFCCFQIVHQSFFISQINAGDIPNSISSRPSRHLADHSRNSSVVDRDLILLLLFGLGEYNSIGIILFAGSDCKLFFLGVNKEMNKRGDSQVLQQLPC